MLGSGTAEGLGLFFNYSGFEVDDGRHAEIAERFCFEGGLGI